MARQPGSKERLRRFLQGRVGEVVTKDQLQAAAGYDVTEWARRIRELRNEEGWNIQSHRDSASLKPGEYCLVEEPPAPGSYVFTRTISDLLRAQILERNGFTCQTCGAAAGDTDERGRTVQLQIGHQQDHSHGGEESKGNLFAQCMRCNEGGKNLTAEPPSWTVLLTQIRRARGDDQRQALAWLKKKFETDTLL